MMQEWTGERISGGPVTFSRSEAFVDKQAGRVFLRVYMGPLRNPEGPCKTAPTRRKSGTKQSKAGLSG